MLSIAIKLLMSILITLAGVAIFLAFVYYALIAWSWLFMLVNMPVPAAQLRSYADDLVDRIIKAFKFIFHKEQK